MFKSIVITLGLAGGLAFIGCGDNGNNGNEDMANGGGADLAGSPDMAEPECYDNPMTHLQIINGCTSAQSVTKMPFFPAKAPGGVLPNLP